MAGDVLYGSSVCVLRVRYTIKYTIKIYTLHKPYPEFQIAHQCREEKAISRELLVIREYSRDRLMPWSGTGSWVTVHSGHGSQNVTHCQLCLRVIAVTDRRTERMCVMAPRTYIARSTASKTNIYNRGLHL